MPSIPQRKPAYKRRKDAVVEWNNLKKGLNLLLKPTELKLTEMAQADNIMLVGEGVPTGRWGTVPYFTAGATGTIAGMGTYIQDGANEFLALTDRGYLYKKNGTGSDLITGQSWPSGSTMRTEQLGGETYIVSENLSFVTYDGTDLSIFTTVSKPTGLTATNFSGATGTNRISYKVVAKSFNGGTTEPSTNYVVANAPSDLTKSSYKLFWSAPSAISLSGYEIYRGREGDELFLAAVDPATTNYHDFGLDTSVTLGPPLTNTTGGIKSKFIKKYQNRLVVVDKDKPSKIKISGLYPKHTSFALMDGGGSKEIDPDSGDDITGIEVQPIANKLVVYKNRSSYLVQLEFVTLGSFYLLDPSYSPISTSVGCSNQDTIATVENDTFYFGRDGIYVTGYEPNYLNIIRTNEVSARIRPYFSKLNSDDYDQACAFYINNKYILSFPRLREMVVYDRERGSFAGIWKLPYGISHVQRYIDGSGTERWVLGSSESNQLYTFDINTNNDDGTAIVKTIRTSKDDIGDWTQLAILKFFYVLFRAITGTVTVNILIEDRAGETKNIKTFTITGSEVAGSSGYGIDTYGSLVYGESSGDFSAAATELTRWGSLFKQVRLVQMEITSSTSSSNFELLAAKLTATPQTQGVLSSSQRV
jgi:hypothetical protein